MSEEKAMAREEAYQKQIRELMNRLVKHSFNRSRTLYLRVSSCIVLLSNFVVGEGVRTKDQDFVIYKKCIYIVVFMSINKF